PQEVMVAGRLLRPGSKVRLQPRPGGDILDGALAGRVAEIEGIDEDDTGAVHVAVILDDDPGRDLGATRHPAHRFFFAPSELEPFETDADADQVRTDAAPVDKQADPALDAELVATYAEAV